MVGTDQGFSGCVGSEIEREIRVKVEIHGRIFPLQHSEEDFCRR